MRHHRTLAVAGGLLAALAITTTTLAATVVVRPGSLDGWDVQTSGTTQSVAFEAGPGTPPLGAGSAELRVGGDGNGAAQLRNVDYAGTALTDLTALEYSTYVDVDGSGGQAPYLILQLDLTGDGSVDDLLFFEPVYQSASFFPSNPQPAVALDTWQTWDALNGGWWSVNGVAGATPGTGVKSLADYLAVEPGATIVNSANGAGGVRVVAGFGAGAWDSFVGNVDAFTIAVDGQSTTFDFEASLPEPATRDSCKNGGWAGVARSDGSAFRNQGDCIQYVNTGR